MGWNGGARKADGLTTAIERGLAQYERRVARAAAEEVQEPITPAQHVEACWQACGWACPHHRPAPEPQGRE
jgi:hypothetical protein